MKIPRNASKELWQKTETTGGGECRAGGRKRAIGRVLLLAEGSSLFGPVGKHEGGCT
jgi:hypothetical protein